MSQKMTGTLILACLVLLAASRVEAKETTEGAIPPFCVATPACGPDAAAKGTEKKGNVPVPKEKPSASTSCDMGNKAGGSCYFLQSVDKWLCCSKSPYADKR